MKLDLSKAYKTLLVVDKLSRQASLDHRELDNEVRDSSERLSEDIERFVSLLTTINKGVESKDTSKINRNIVALCGVVRDIETELSNFADEIEKLVQGSDLFNSEADLGE